MSPSADRPTSPVLKHVMSVAKFERFFRASGGLDIDKDDIKRYDDFVNRKVYDLLVRGQAIAKANHRDVIEPHDLPITKGLQENIERFRKLDEEIALQPILEHPATLPLLDRAYSDQTEARLPEIAGGLSVALARTFKIVDPTIKNLQGPQWERCTRIFNELV
jgi:hypothetical protein